MTDLGTMAYSFASVREGGYPAPVPGRVKRIGDNRRRRRSPSAARSATSGMVMFQSPPPVLGRILLSPRAAEFHDVMAERVVFSATPGHAAKPGPADMAHRMSIMSMRLRFLLLAYLVFAGSTLSVVEEQITGVAPGIPEPQQRNVIVQLFNWRSSEITKVLPRLRAIGYSRVHVSPPQTEQ
jgi:hypothetical protein